jgi:hypothetical protein
VLPLRSLRASEFEESGGPGSQGGRSGLYRSYSPSEERDPECQEIVSGFPASFRKILDFPGTVFGHPMPGPSGKVWRQRPNGEADHSEPAEEQCRLSHPPRGVLDAGRAGGAGDSAISTTWIGWYPRRKGRGGQSARAACDRRRARVARPSPRRRFAACRRPSPSDGPTSPLRRRGESDPRCDRNLRDRQRSRYPLPNNEMLIPDHRSRANTLFAR